jgi:hypothetical protein
MLMDLVGNKEIFGRVADFFDCIKTINDAQLHCFFWGSVFAVVEPGKDVIYK